MVAKCMGIIPLSFPIWYWFHVSFWDEDWSRLRASLRIYGFEGGAAEEGEAQTRIRESTFRRQMHSGTYNRG